MCEYFSCIIQRDLTVLWDKLTTSHEEIIKNNNLKDDKLDNRDFVRIEINPKDKYNVTKEKSSWEFKIDEKGTLPKWYEKHSKMAEQKCWEAWEESIKIQCVFSGESKTFKNCLGFGYGNSTVEACGNSTVKAYNDSTVEAWGNSTVKAYGNSTVKAYDNSTVKAYNDSTVKAWDNTTVKILSYSNVDIKNISIKENAQIINLNKKEIIVCKNIFKIKEVKKNV